MHTALFAVVLTLQSASVPPAAQADVIGEAYYLFLQGQAFEERDDFVAAAEQYRRALALVPDAAGVRAELAGIYAQQGDLAAARKEAEQALSTSPGNRPAHRLLGLIAASSVEGLSPVLAAPRIRSAIDHLERARTDGVQDPAVTLTLGDMYVRGAQHDKAIATLQQFLLDRPGYPQAVMLLVQAYRAAGKPEMAEAVINAFRSESTDSTSTAGRLRGIEALETRGNWAQAAASWARLLEEQPGEVSYRLRYAAALVNAGDTDRGREELTAITRDEPAETRAWYLLTQVEQRAGRSAEAEAAARRIVELDPEDGRGPIALAMVLGHRGDHRGVVSVLGPRVAAPTERDIESGMFAEMATMLSDAHVDLGDVSRGIRTLEDARKQTPDDAELLFALASTYERDDQAGRAERVFREIIAADPDHAAALNYLGYMLADRGQKLPEALGFIERAIAVGGENPSYLDSLGWAYYRMSRFADAVGPLERAAEGAPTVSVIQDHLGDAYMKLERYEQAAAAFDRALAGDRDGIDEKALTRKRDRARAASGRR
ncbi:MAG: tetratricopeptide repeat protein [Acidobacteria bacterium]|nr:tetratricopeptide repeat protein [Acidobacteriota bacterium]